ncbi:hypothetical protein [Caproiciproducens sp. LBM24188]|nr:hypothetical protein [Oscillospiraceae bacterium]HHV33016.1 hypothetical protein [Clostridiales bacterium]
MKKRVISAVLALAAVFTMLAGCKTVSTVHNAAAPVEPAAVQTVAETTINVSEEEALNAVRQTIRVDYSKHPVCLVNSALKYKNEEYYQFQISSLQPYLIVSKENGAVYCYYDDQTVTEVYQDKTFGSKC